VADAEKHFGICSELQNVEYVVTVPKNMMKEGKESTVEDTTPAVWP